MSEFRIRPAQPHEAEALTAIAVAAKAYWGYPAAVMRQWLPELVVSREIIACQPVHVAEQGGKLLGLTVLQAGTEPVRELEALWVHPHHIGKGIGTLLLSHAARVAKAAGAWELFIDADPYAEQFYLSRGVIRTGEVAAPIEGQPNRVRPHMRLPLHED